MRWFRRHRGSQEDLAPVVHISAPPKGFDPAEVARVFSYALGSALDGRRPPQRLTARQVLTASLRRDELLAEEPDHVETLVKGILLDLNEAGLEIVAREDVE